MSFSELALVLVGSLVHIGWNVLAKAQARQQLFLAWALFFSGVLPGIYLVATRPMPLLLPVGLFWVIGSALLHVVYFSFLAKAYEVRSDLSFVYPFSRGIGAVLSTLTGLLLFRDHISRPAQIGIPLILIGTFIEPFFEWRKQTPSGRITKSQFGLSLLTGISIAAYLTWDKLALKFIKTEQLLAPMLTATSLFLLVNLSQAQRISIRPTKDEFINSLLGALFIFGSYHLILLAMETASLSYITAARSSGIVFSAFIGPMIFKEKIGPSRWVGIFLVSLGLILIAF